MKKILCFDIDGVICETLNGDYINARPKKEVIELINKLNKNYKIIIFTARYMGRNNDKISNAKKDGYQFTKKQLLKWGLKFHKLYFGKPSYDIFVDDKNLGHKKNWVLNFKKVLNKKFN
jgi:histidinol phosphatase-like enzyme